MAYEFLSNDWLDEVDKIRAEFPAPEAPAGVDVQDLKINVTVTGGPDGDVEGHLVGTNLERGHFDGAPTKITLPYDVAKSMFIDGNQQAAMQAFMSGQIKVEGDMTKLMAMQGGAAATPPPELVAMQEKIKEITA
jgi:hypothetical protein